jgi:small subunit ribosomal protein S12e
MKRGVGSGKSRTQVNLNFELSTCFLYPHTLIFEESRQIAIKSSWYAAIPPSTHCATCKGSLLQQCIFPPPEYYLTYNPQSDGEEDHVSVAAAEEEVEVSADAPAGKGQMSVLEALKGVLKLALIHDGLARGLREASKALDRRQAHMCVLNEACEEEAYKKLVVALCSEHKIPLIKVPDGKQLGEWAGLCTSTLFRIVLGVEDLSTQVLYIGTWYANSLVRPTRS